MSTANVQALVARKQYIFEELTRVHDIVTKKDFKGEIHAEVNLVTLERLEKAFLDLVTEILTVNATVEKGKGVTTKDFDTFHTLIDNIRICCLRCKAAATVTAKREEHERASLKLPKISLPFFSGEPGEWNSFIDQYNSAIHTKPISNIEKLTYLRSVLKKEPLAIVMQYELKNDSYDMAYRALVERFNNPRLLASHHINKILNFKFNQHSRRQFSEFLEIHKAATSSILSLNIPNLANYLLFEFSYRNLPLNYQKHFDREKGPTELPSLENLLEFIDKLAKTEELHSDPNPIGKAKNQKILLGVTNEKIIRTCPYCKQEHPLFRCNTFPTLPLEKKLLVVAKYKACKSCLGLHKGVCKSSYTCRHCRGKNHHTFLCDKQHTVNELQRKSNGPQVTEKAKETDCPIPCNSCFSKQLPTILLGTIKTYAADCWGNLHEVRAVCDTGSQVNLITNSLVKRLGLKRTYSPFDIQGVSQRSTKNYGEVIIKLTTDESDSTTYYCTALVLPTICGNLPTSSFPKTLPEEMSELPLADSEFYDSKPIDILLGADAWADILSTEEPTIIKGNPTAQRTIFGFVLLGRFPPKRPQVSVNLCTSLDKTLRSFWESENVSPEIPRDPDDVYCEDHFAQTVSRDNTGRYVVRLPFRKDATPLGTNFNKCFNSFIRLEERFKRNPKLAEAYKLVIDDYLRQGHMSPALTEENYVLPHHCVFKDSSTTAVRVVFDASSLDETGQSINSRLLSGPKLQNELPQLLINFRLHEVALQADIKQMFRNIKIHPENKRYQHLLWRTSQNEELKQYSLNTVTFGFTCAPFLAQRVLRQLAYDEGDPYPEAKNAILHHSFMDDFVTGAPSIQDARRLRESLSELLAKGGFELRKWASSHEEVLNQLPDELKETQFTFPTGEKGVKVLGLLWDQTDDCLRFHVSKFDAPEVTKRSILSYIAAIWDCLGLVSPVVIKAKVFLQRLWLLKVDWDENLPSDLCSSWLKLTSEMPLLQDLKIPRKLPIMQSELRLIGFSDASEAAMAANVYLHCVQPGGNTECRLLMSKTKLAPIKTMTIPRLELTAAVLLSKTVAYVLETGLKIKEILLFTDSQIVISWLKTPPCNLKIFVANRVIQILENLPNASWKFIPGKLNPADLSSRGLSPYDLINNRLWWSGPSFLLQPHQSWPDFNQDAELQPQECPEIREPIRALAVNVLDEDEGVLHLIENTSSFTKLIRIVAFILRFAYNSKIKIKQKENYLSTEELKASLLTCVRLTQNKYFKQDIDNLRQNKDVSKNLVKLSPFLDESQLLRAGGRLRRAECLSDDAKYPLILPKRCNLSAIICDYYHLKLLHAGPKTTQAAILQKFWILSSNQLIRHRIRLCLRCYKQSAKPKPPLMGELPHSRVNVSRPFTNVAVDFGGPINTKESRLRSSGKHKSYFCVFVCMCTKAVHIEAVTDLTSKAFLAAFLRFSSRRGLPLHVYSDCGRNFVGAARELDENAKAWENSLKEFSTLQGISWHFSPPYAPNFNGLAEGAIKLTKTHFMRQVGEEILTLEEFTTLLCRIEAVLNSRPLVALSSDPNEKNLYLCPAHFLIGDQILSPPECPEKSMPMKTRWELVQRKSNQFWNQWSRHYLHTMIQRQRWTKPTENLKVGQIVFITGESLPPLQWPLGRVEALRYGEDGVARVAMIKCPKGVVCRPVSKLLVLPEDE